jgi:hypothetical protein
MTNDEIITLATSAFCHTRKTPSGVTVHGNVTDRGRLCKILPSSEANKLAQAFGLRNIDDHSTPGIKPTNDDLEAIVADAQAQAKVVEAVAAAGLAVPAHGGASNPWRTEKPGERYSPAQLTKQDKLVRALIAAHGKQEGVRRAEAIARAAGVSSIGATTSARFQAEEKGDII